MKQKQNQKKYMKLVSLVLVTVMTLTILTPLGIGRTIEDRLPDPPIQYETQKLLASDGMTEDNFGRSVAIDGEIAIVGTPYVDGNTYNEGAAYIFRFDGTAWVEEQKLQASDGQELNVFGEAVAINNDLVVVGAPRDNDNGYCSGSAYVFRYDGSSWVEEAKLLPSDGSEIYYFGSSVGISGNAIIVGAPAWDPGIYQQGKAYIFRYDGSTCSTWIEEQKIMASDGVPGDWFGNNVAIDGNVVGITAIGGLYINRYDGSTWVEEQKLAFPSVIRVGISDDVFIVGISQDYVNGVMTGAAYIYRYDGSTWIEEQKIFASDGEVSDYFGSSVAIDDDIAIVGADNDGHSQPYAIDGHGSAYLFRYNGSAWVEEKKLMASDAAQSDLFGRAVAIWNNIAISGVSGDTNGNGHWAGSAYIFNLPIPGDANGNGVVDVQDLLIVLAQWGTSGPEGDVNDDGIVNVEDILLVLANWTT